MAQNDVHALAGSRVSGRCSARTMLGFVLLCCVLVVLTPVHAHRCAGKGKGRGRGGAAAVDDYDYCPGYDPDTAPLSEYLLCESQDLLDQAYASAFIQGIKSGVMRPQAYAKYDLQDWVYLAGAASLYGSVCDNKICDATLTAFFQSESESFAALAAAYPTTYSVKTDMSAVVEVLEPTQTYVDWEVETSAANDAEYTVVIMAPCLQTWAPLATRLFDEGAMTDTSAYSFWIEENKDYVPTDLNAILDSYTYERDAALDIYRQGVQYEIDMFNLATVTRNSMVYTSQAPVT